MGRGKKCIVVCNTKSGYCMSPKKCESIAEAVRYGKSLGMAYRVFVNGRVVKSGW